MSKHKWSPMPGYAILAPLKDPAANILVPGQTPETGLRVYVEQIGSTVLPSQAGWVSVERIQPGMEVRVRGNAEVQMLPDERMLVRIYDIVAYTTKDEDGSGSVN